MSTPKVIEPGDPAGAENQNSIRVYRTKDGSKRKWNLVAENSGGGSTNISAVGVSNDGINWTAPSGDQVCGGPDGYTTPAAAWMNVCGAVMAQ